MYSIEDYRNLRPEIKEICEEVAQMMALDINGGLWDKDYSEAQKNGWRLKAWWCHRAVMNSHVTA